MCHPHASHSDKDLTTLECAMLYAWTYPTCLEVFAMSQIRGASSEGDYYNSEYVIFIVFYFLFFCVLRFIQQKL